MERICYVSIPFGRKPDAMGGTIDFDEVFSNLIRPAVEAAGVGCRRGDEFSGGNLHKSILSLVLGSEVMIADLTNGNPNVMYELGIRSVASRSGAILICAENNGRLPFNVNYMGVLTYPLRDSDAARKEFQSRLTDVVRRDLNELRVGALYEFFPDLDVRLPKELERKAVIPAALQQQAVIQRLGALQDADSVREISRSVAALPRATQGEPEVARAYALALNRQGNLEDRDRAVEILLRTLDEHGPDAETLAALGRIMKDRYADSGDDEDQEAARDAFAAAFLVNPHDFYSGVNAVLLLSGSSAPDAQDTFASLLPAVRQSLQNENDEYPLDFWRLSAALTLAILARDWADARRLADQIHEAPTADWMIDWTGEQLRQAARTMTEADRKKIDSLLHTTRSK